LLALCAAHDGERPWIDHTDVLLFTSIRKLPYDYRDLFEARTGAEGEVPLSDYENEGSSGEGEGSVPIKGVTVPLEVNEVVVHAEKGPVSCLREDPNGLSASTAPEALGGGERCIQGDKASTRNQSKGGAKGLDTTEGTNDTPTEDKTHTDETRRSKKAERRRRTRQKAKQRKREMRAANVKPHEEATVDRNTDAQT
jgi:hypothetical protein